MNTPRARRLRAAVLALALLVPFVVLSLHPVCHAIFSCGCEPVWARGIETCNIHTPGVPHCPWCTPLFPMWAALAAGPGLLAATLAARRSRSGLRSLGAGLLGYALGALVSGLIAALVTGYPLWLGLRI
jgi:hypothetical protein